MDNLNLQAVYRGLLKRAEFKNIQFRNDPYFMEDVLFASTKK